PSISRHARHDEKTGERDHHQDYPPRWGAHASGSRVGLGRRHGAPLLQVAFPPPASRIGGTALAPRRRVAAALPAAPTPPPTGQPESRPIWRTILDDQSMVRKILPGRRTPLGATWDGEGVNFAVYSQHATKVELCLFSDADPAEEIERIALPE